MSWKHIKRSLIVEAKGDALQPLEYVAATKASNSISGTNARLMQTAALSMEKSKKVKGSVDEGLFSKVAAKKYGKIKDIEEQAVTVKGARSSGNLYQPAAILRSLTWKQVAQVGPGFYNQGNTCFLNSVLQCLMYIPSLAQPLCDVKERRFILRGMNDSKDAEGHQSHHKSPRTILVHFSELVNEVWGGRGSRASITPRSMVSTIRRVSRLFRPGRQEDAHEYLRYLTDCMHEEILKAHGVKLSDGDVAETTFISRIFGGKLCSELRCDQCRYTSRTYNYYQDLSLEVSGSISSVDEAMKAFLKPEKLTKENAWRCDGCKKHVQASKQMSVWEAPNVLVVHLKRFTFGKGKINKPVEYTEFLSVSERSLQAQFASSKHGKAAKEEADAPPRMRASGNSAAKKYRLVGVVVHHGHSSHSGHYVAYVRGPNEQWYHMNDSQVSVVSLKNVLRQQAYILFYSARGGTQTESTGPGTEKTPKKRNIEQESASKKAGRGEGGSSVGSEQDMGEPVDERAVAEMRRRYDAMQQSLKDGNTEVIKDRGNIWGSDSADDDSDFDSADYVDEYSESDEAGSDSPGGDATGTSSSPGLSTPSVTVNKFKAVKASHSVQPMRFPFLSPLFKFFRRVIGHGARVPLRSDREGADLGGGQDQGNHDDDDDDDDEDEDEDDNDDDDDSSSSSSSSSSSTNMHMSTPTVEQSRDSIDREDERTPDESSTDVKGLILQQARRSKSTSGEGQWDTVDTAEAEDKASMERRAKKASQKLRNAKRASTWDAHLDSGRVKKTKADKEASKGVHESWLDEAGREERAAASKGPRGSALGDVTVNPFQAVADKTGNRRRFLEDDLHQSDATVKKRKKDHSKQRSPKQGGKRHGAH